MFEGFERRTIETTGATINLRIGGSGPALLLLHGFPQTHVMWHATAPRLAERFTVVAADLRGYGDSSKPEGEGAYAKRAMALDMAEVMAALGFERFRVGAHDRGARVAHRLALDHAERVERLALLDIVPTRTLFEATRMDLAMGYYHWFFLAQPAPFPETLINAAPIGYLRTTLGRWGCAREVFPEPVRAEYERCIQDPSTVHAMCEDYRAAATIDLVHDRADEDRRIQCPLLVMWGEQGFMHRMFDVPATWHAKHARPEQVEARPAPCGHYLAEEAPDVVVDAFETFFGAP